MLGLGKVFHAAKALQLTHKVVDGSLILTIGPRTVAILSGVALACGAWLGMSILIKLFSWEGFTPDISDDVEMVTMQTLNDEVGYSGTVEPLDHCANTLIGIDGRCFDRDFAQTTELETCDEIDADTYDPAVHDKPGLISCYDPATMDFLGHAPAMSAEDVKALIARAREAQEEWKFSTFAQRRKLLRTIQKYILQHQEDICRVSARDSGKAMVDAAFGEIMVTCEKISWLLSEGERWLLPERRSAGKMMFYKSARVEFHPYGVIGAIVPFNYPFHNVFNPLTAALFAGNAIVIKVSEHASWSIGYYKRIIDAALRACDAPEGLVQIVTGYGEAGNALVTGGTDKVIFVGSTIVGSKVMEAAASRLVPVVLELGGKDAIVVCDDADYNQAFNHGMRGGFQSNGQNCAGAERYFVHASLYERWIQDAAEAASKLRQGPPVGGAPVDVGALCLPGLAEKIHGLVEDARSKGAKVLAGGYLPVGPGQYYPPTVIAGVDRSMKIFYEEVFGPVMSVIPWETDEEVIDLVNDCPFGLGSNVFSGSKKRANAIAARLEAGMSTINDFATTYMCQSLPFGGVKLSGFDRFAGVEGLRGLCIPKSVCEDGLPFMKTAFPPPLRYPVSDIAFDFVQSLVKMFYGLNILQQLSGLVSLAGVFVLPKKTKTQ